MNSSLVAVIASVALASYVIWAVHRLYVVFGKCPRCRRRLNRTAEVCSACGCRPHEYVADQQKVAASRAAHG